MGSYHRFTLPRAPVAPTADELAAFAEDDAYETWRDEMAELAMHNRAYAEGDWDLDDFLEWSPVGRGEAAAHQRSTWGLS